METFQIIGMILILLFLFLVTAVVLVYEWSLLVTRAPFVGIPKAIIPEIIKAMNLDTDSVVYDLGCGDGRVLFAGQDVCPEARFVGVDKAFAAIVTANVRKYFNKKTSVKLIHKNFFKQDLSEATHIFVYLFPGLMKSLLPKLKKELKRGTIVISCDFEFKDIEPAKIIDLKRAKHELGQRLIVYEF